MTKRRYALGIMSAFQRMASTTDVQFLFARDFAFHVDQGKSYANAYRAAREEVPNIVNELVRDYDLDEADRRELLAVQLPSQERLSAFADAYGVPDDREGRRAWARRAADDRIRAPQTEAAAPRRAGTTPAALRRRIEAGEDFSFDLPPHKTTRAAFAKQHPPGTTCLKLPQEGGPFGYKICSVARDEEGKKVPANFSVEAYEVGTKNVVGTVEASRKYGRDPRSPSYKVGWAEVVNIDYDELSKPEEERTKPSGLGTRLYERALRAVCDVGKAYSITSDTTRSEFSEAFWRKQVRKGRAKCVGDGSQSAYFRAPLVDARQAFDKLKDGEAKFERFYNRLPHPQDDERGYRRWSCDYYEMLCAKRPDSLDGLRIKSAKPKRRKR